MATAPFSGFGDVVAYANAMDSKFPTAGRIFVDYRNIFLPIRSKAVFQTACKAGLKPACYCRGGITIFFLGLCEGIACFRMP